MNMIITVLVFACNEKHKVETLFVFMSISRSNVNEKEKKI